MTKWDYMFAAQMTAKLAAEYGSKGWELVAVADGLFYFKRPSLEQSLEQGDVGLLGEMVNGLLDKAGVPSLEGLPLDRIRWLIREWHRLADACR